MCFFFFPSILDRYRLVILFIALIHYICCLKMYLHQTLQMGFVFVLKMFQNKCNRDCNRDYFQWNCNHNQKHNEKVAPAKS